MDILKTDPSIFIVIREHPISFNMLYGQTGNRRFMYKRGKEYKKKVREIAKEAVDNPTPQGIVMEITYYFPDNRRRDVQNYERCICDSLIGIVYNDDSQITDMTLRKRMDKEDPRTVIKIWEII